MPTAPLVDQLRLLDLQDLDTTIARLGHERRSLPVLTQIAELTGRADDLHDELVLAASAAGDARRALTKAEADVEQVRSRARRNQERLDSGQGLSRELVALQEELEHLAGRQATLEEAELEAMEVAEETDARVTALKEQSASVATDLESLGAERDAAFTRIDADVAARRSERDELAGTLPGPLLDEYEAARRQTGGLGAVAVRGHRAEGVAVDFTLAEQSMIDRAAEDEILVSEDHGFILVRVGDRR
ncbi:zinc ribbon domain-containing protein [Georgenia sp. Z1491]|uniref:zinc ribbon domain-containing protein n=1 Tax=Georgenia sp. Z1491 TaxID=3416707 RepID=UPI003CF2EF73